jgi:transcriptional regulator with XRE-family HTH domain
MYYIGRRIVNLREKQNISQVLLADKIKVTKATMSKYEHDRTIPNADTLAKIADALDTTTDYLTGRTENEAPIARGESWVRVSSAEAEVMHRYSLLTHDNKIRIDERLTVLLEAQSNKENK